MSSNKGKKIDANKLKGPRRPKGPGPFKPTVRLPMPQPPAPPAPPSLTSRAPVLATEAGTLESVGREADAALAMGRRILGMLNVESKAFAYQNTGTLVDQTGLMYSPLTAIVQGDTDAQRDGDSLKLKGWEGHLQFTRGGVDAVVSYMLIQEGPSFVLGNIPLVYSAATTAVAPLSQPNWDARLGFKVLAHGVFGLTNADPYRLVKFDHKFNHDVQYYNNTAVVYEGNVSVVFISNINGATCPTVAWSTLLSWIDN